MVFSALILLNLSCHYQTMDNDDKQNNLRINIATIALVKISSWIGHLTFQNEHFSPVLRSKKAQIKWL